MLNKQVQRLFCDFIICSTLHNILAQFPRLCSTAHGGGTGQAREFGGTSRGRKHLKVRQTADRDLLGAKLQYAGAAPQHHNTR